jgi:hypothetical protein
MEYREEIYAKGQLVSVVDTRTLAGEKARRIAICKQVAGDAIAETYPAYKQHNAALGICSPQAVQAIKEGVQALRTVCDTQEAAIHACESLAELDGLYF